MASIGIHDCTTGETVVRLLTPEEEAQRLLDVQAGATLQAQQDTLAAGTVEATNDLRTNAQAAHTRLAALYTDPASTDTPGKVRQGLADVAHIVDRLLKHATPEAR